ncbi:hypothetical protein Tco_1185361 [Tanacetum coccineum]
MLELQDMCDNHDLSRFVPVFVEAAKHHIHGGDQLLVILCGFGTKSLEFRISFLSMTISEAASYAYSGSLLLTPLCCDDIHVVTPRVSALAGCDRLVSEPSYREVAMSPPICRKYCDSVAFATGRKRIKNCKRCNRKIRIPIAMWPCRVKEKMTLKEVDGQMIPVGQPRKHDLYGFVDHPQLQQGNPINEFAPHRLPQPEGNMNGWLIEDEEKVEKNEVDSDLESIASSKPVWKKTTKADHDRASRNCPYCPKFVPVFVEAVKHQVAMSPPIRRKYRDSVAFATGHKRIKNCKRCNRKIRIPIAMWPCRVEEKMTLKEVDTQTVEEIETKIISKDGTRVLGKFQGYETSEEEPMGQPRKHDLYGFVDHPQLQQGNPMNEFAPHRLPQLEGNMNGWLIEDEEEVEKNEVDSDLKSTASSKPVWKKTTKADHDRASRNCPYCSKKWLHRVEVIVTQVTNNVNNGNGGNGGGGNGNGGNNSCTYKGFLACNPKEYDGKGGAIALTRWIERMETVIDNSGCAENQKVKYVASSFVNKALTWWNTQVQERGREAIIGMSWNDFKALLVEEFCPSNEMEKLKSEL